MADAVAALFAFEQDAADAAKALAALQTVEARHVPKVAGIFAREAHKNTASLLRALVVLGALSLVNPATALDVMKEGALLHTLVSVSNTPETSCAMAHALAEASSDVHVRTWLAQTPFVTEWLAPRTSLAKFQEVGQVQACADLAWIKLAMQTNDKTKKALSLSEQDTTTLYTALRDFFVSDGAQVQAPKPLLAFHEARAARDDALEGMYYLLFMPALRNTFCHDAPMLAAMVRILTLQTSADGDSALAFVLVSMLATLVAYPAKRTAEQQRAEALRRAASNQADDPLLAPEQVSLRVRALVHAGIVAPLVPLTVRAVRIESALRDQLAGLFLSLVTPQDSKFRGLLLQQGVGRALLLLSQTAHHTLRKPAPPNYALLPLQALAKLTITADPRLMYHAQGTPLLAVQCLASLYFAPHATLLQFFEAVMALTNMSSMDEPMAGVVARAVSPFPDADGANISDSLLSNLLLHDEPMVRKALVELLCNLVQDPHVFAYWAGEGTSAADDISTATIHLQTAQGRLRFLVSLCEGDIGLAASGTLACLTSAVSACQYLVRMPTSSLETLAELLGASEQLALRGFAILYNLVQYAASLAPNPDGLSKCEALGALHDARFFSATKAFVARHAAPQNAALPTAQALAMALDILKLADA
ncbi:SWI5-dependent HO expression protein 4 [Malassezia vespertilionis]|uniref:UNC-45/Cro1/She4 central domain-containing protein n=1 Tax=Malassezia vespertilionis TaxID=2020962 RepID=A0A2N1JAT1_9BASI|nr:SWI5-dependent HO expression protein 4 [Malassezia vespertilionis]PKI83668.1 hypothetical protein MVES_002588 [Malassezia vespertilionis]WFD07377.1 SWI5-dependent HO expression protein 4 [Malassezia vespertilionis]